MQDRRFEVFEFSNKNKIPLLHCDMFPYNGKYVVNYNLAEDLILNAAVGFAEKSNVFIYGVCGFLLHRIECIKLNLNTKLQNACVLFNAGGSNNPYCKDWGKGHQFFEDLELFKVFGIENYTLENQVFNDLMGEVLKTPGFKVVRI